MRWAIIGPIIGFILLYFILRFAVDQFRSDRLALEEYGIATIQDVQIAESTTGDEGAASDEDALAVDEAVDEAVAETEGDAAADEVTDAAAADDAAADTPDAEAAEPAARTPAQEAAAAAAVAAEAAAEAAEAAEVAAEAAAIAAESEGTEDADGSAEPATDEAATGDEDAAQEGAAGEATAADESPAAEESEPAADGSTDGSEESAATGEDAAAAGDADQAPAESSDDEAAADDAGTDTGAAEPEPDDASADAASDVTDTLWIVSRLNGEQPLGGWPMTAMINEDGTMIGSAGCNYYNSSIALDGDAVSIAVPTSTRMACPSDAAMAQENEFLSTLTEITGAALGNAQLVLTGADGAEIEFTSIEVLFQSNWFVDTLLDAGGELTPILADSEITALFDGSILSGYDGCSNYSAAYQVDGEIVVFEPVEYTVAGAGVGVTCEEETAEQQQAIAYGTALGDTRFFELTPEHLRFYNEARDLLVSFVPGDPR